MKIYIVYFLSKVRGVYSCPTDANSRIKELGGGEIITSNLNFDVN